MKNGDLKMKDWSQVEQEQPKGKYIKKRIILAAKFIYLVFAFLLTLVLFLSVPDIDQESGFIVSNKDLFIFKLKYIAFAIFVFVLPGVFTIFDNMRKYIPLYNKKKLALSFVGWIVLCIIGVNLQIAIDNLHSNEFQWAMSKAEANRLIEQRKEEFLEAKEEEKAKLEAEAKYKEENAEKLKAEEEAKAKAAAEEKAKAEAESKAKAEAEAKKAKEKEEKIISEIKNLEKQISELGDIDSITYEKLDDIRKASIAYKNLNQEHRQLVKNSELLKNAEKIIPVLQAAKEKADEKKAVKEYKEKCVDIPWAEVVKDRKTYVGTYLKKDLMVREIATDSSTEEVVYICGENKGDGSYVGGTFTVYDRRDDKSQSIKLYDKIYVHGNITAIYLTWSSYNPVYEVKYVEFKGKFGD